MSGNDDRPLNEEQRRIQARMRFDEIRAEMMRQERRQERVHTVGKWSFRVVMFFVLFVGLGGATLSGMFTPVSLTTNVTEISCVGDFDKVQVDYENWGDSNAKYYLATITEENETYIGAPQSLGAFYNRSIQFYVTVFLNGSAMPSQSFVLRTEGVSPVLCTGDVVVTFSFGHIGDTVLPFWMMNIILTAILCVAAIFGIPILYTITWWWSDKHWWDSRW